jgi:hypothetical protein
MLVEIRFQLILYSHKQGLIHSGSINACLFKAEHQQILFVAVPLGLEPGSLVFDEKGEGLNQWVFELAGSSQFSVGLVDLREKVVVYLIDLGQFPFSLFDPDRLPKIMMLLGQPLSLPLTHHFKVGVLFNPLLANQLECAAGMVDPAFPDVD